RRPVQGAGAVDRQADVEPLAAAGLVCLLAARRRADGHQHQQHGRPQRLRLHEPEQPARPRPGPRRQRPAARVQDPRQLPGPVGHHRRRELPGAERTALRSHAERDLRAGHPPDRGGSARNVPAGHAVAALAARGQNVQRRRGQSRRRRDRTAQRAELERGPEQLRRPDSELRQPGGVRRRASSSWASSTRSEKPTPTVDSARPSGRGLSTVSGRWARLRRIQPMGGSRRRSFVGLYTASGAAALVYEVTWTRLFSLQLGHTVAAASTVLAAFMGGLAIGAWLAPRAIGARDPRADARALRRAYATVEILVAMSALLLPFALRAAVPLLAWAYADGGAPARLAIVRIATSLLLLGIPAAAMGATFPIAAAWYSATTTDAGVLYAANTAGAAAGAVAAGFWLIPAIGLTGTTWVGVALNAAAAAGALWMASETTRATDTTHMAHAAPAAAGAKRTKPPASVPRVPHPTSSPPVAWIAVGISGFAALIYEVAWTRLLAMIIGPTTYAFATMAAAFVTGLAVGSAV